jgi:hypothetical protein
MSTQSAPPKSNRTPWIIVGALGCLALCLLIVLAGGALYLVAQSPSDLTPTRVAAQPMVSPALPTQPPTTEPTLTPIPPTQSPVPPTLPPLQPTLMPVLPTISGAKGCPPFPAAATKPSGIVGNVTMALGADANYNPINPTVIFPPNAVFHAIVAIQSAPANTKFRATWYTLDIGDPAYCNTTIKETDYAPTGSGSGNVDFSLTPKTQWDAGTYRVEIYVNGTLDTAKSFSVAGTAVQPITVPTNLPTAIATQPPTNSCNLQPGQSGILFTNTYDFKVLLTIGGGDWGTHDYWFEPKATTPIQFPPGNYTATLTVPGRGNYKFSNDRVAFEAGHCYPFTTP